jgi:hypothetical protein
VQFFFNLQKIYAMNELPLHNFIYNTIIGTVQTFIKSWNRLLYPRVIAGCRLSFEPRYDLLHLVSVFEIFSQRDVSLCEGTSGNRRPGSSDRYSEWLQPVRSGDRIPLGARFSAPVQTGPGAHPASCTMGTGSFPGVESGRGVTLTPHPLLVPRSKSRV